MFQAVESASNLHLNKRLQ